MLLLSFHVLNPVNTFFRNNVQIKIDLLSLQNINLALFLWKSMMDASYFSCLKTA